jgi:hypothetical protein
MAATHTLVLWESERETIENALDCLLASYKIIMDFGSLEYNDVYARTLALRDEIHALKAGN